MANEGTSGGARAGAWRSALALGLVVLVGTGLLALVDALTRERIAEQERRAVLQQLGELVSDDRYDNRLHEDIITLRDETAFPGGQTVTAYRARRSGVPVAVILRLAAPDGYSGNIHLLVGIDHDGRLSGVRVTAHKETPGLGDAIEAERSDWIRAFDGRALGAPPLAGWAVRKDGGEFDQFTGATITPRAVVAAVRRALEYFAAHRDTLFDEPAEPPPEAGQ